ncbi:hypothetical protein MMC07_003558 [Pseudocyphellaria aurata]|nr:hypothetical protein [Pseudocyphellaria aurata]
MRLPRSNQAKETIQDLIGKPQYFSASASRTRPYAGWKYSVAGNMSSQSNVSRRALSPSIPSPSASILLISPTNEILLLHRVRTSTSFASAHVFPGGHLSPQDGVLPPVNDVHRHEDSEPYRLAAIRECFEESGIILAKRKDKSEGLLPLTDEERERGRHAIHENQVDFQTWVTQRGGVVDTGNSCHLRGQTISLLLITIRLLSENLIPFTRWLTPVSLPKRFSTQMYLYFLPVPNPLSFASNADAMSQSSTLSQPRANTIYNPTSDGGVEHTAARFLPPSEWLSLYATNEILLFAPQFFLLYLISPFLSPSPSPSPHSLNSSSPSSIDISTVLQQRQALITFTHTSSPPWTEKCICPNQISGPGQQAILTLHEPGLELAGTHRNGDTERVIMVENRKGTWLPMEVRRKSDIYMLADSDRSGGEKL